MIILPIQTKNIISTAVSTGQKIGYLQTSMAGEGRKNPVAM
jgi:hypothetical protein